MKIDKSAAIVKIVSRAIMASNKNVVCLIKEAISAINFDGSWSTGIVKQKLEEYREFYLINILYHRRNRKHLFLPYQL